MSIEATEHVWKHSDATGSSRLVMLAIARYSSPPRDGYCESYPAIDQIAQDARMPVSRVKDALEELVWLGELQIIEPRTPIGRATYRIRGGGR